MTSSGSNACFQFFSEVPDLIATKHVVRLESTDVKEIRETLTKNHVSTISSRVTVELSFDSTQTFELFDKNTVSLKSDLSPINKQPIWWHLMVWKRFRLGSKSHLSFQ